MADLIGKTIGRYQVLEQVGQGGMADVYKAYHPSLDRLVAIKVIHPFLADDKDFVARFQREAKAVATLRHPNIVQVYDFDSANGTHYMVMEYIDGVTLKSMLESLQERGGALGLDDAVRIILSVGSALKYAHGRSMVHRDVKPGNVMITGEGHVILTDFGIARILSTTNLTASGAMVGTPSYMSPEQGRGEPGDERSDIYSLGIMLYQLTVGRLPFGADTPLAVVLKHINDPPPLPTSLRPDLPSGIEQVILKALAKNPGDRYQNVGAFTTELKIVAGMSAEMTPTDTMQRGAAIRLTGVEVAVPARASAPLQSDISPVAAREGHGRKLALIIGNSEYEDANLARLLTPGEDANEFARVLQDAAIGNFEEVTPLINQPSSIIRRAISQFYANKNRDDLLLLYFSGHGVLDDRGQLYLAVKDTEHNLLRGTAIGAAFVTDEMDRSYSRRQVLILDCCHSGAFARGSKGAPGMSVGTAAAFEGTGYARAVMTATDSTEYAWEGDQVIGQAEKSIFTHYLVEGLQTGAADIDSDGRITLDELYDYVHAQVVNRTPKQTPAMWSYKQKEEIVIARNPRPVQKPTELPEDLKTAVQSTSVWMREGVVTELDRLLRGNQPDLACAAYGALTVLKVDDSRRVSEAATKSLDTYIEAWRSRSHAAGVPDRAASEPDIGAAAESSIAAIAAERPSRKRVPRAALIGLPAIALLLSVVIALVASQSGQPPVSVNAPVLPSAGAMVKVASGTYAIGRDSSGENYAPAQSVAIGEFWIDQHEVTNAQYAEFLAKSGGLPPAGWPKGAISAGQDDFPVEGVTWEQAGAFCGWAHKRLPTEAEWEVAARGPEGWLYPWGNDEHLVELSDSGPYAVGKVPANRSAFGVYDMAGNVWEWVGDTYAPVPNGQKVLRGGGYGFLKDMAYRLHGDPNVRTMFAMAGIRCAADNVAKE